jgi:hypothetical protein
VEPLGLAKVAVLSRAHDVEHLHLAAASTRVATVAQHLARVRVRVRVRVKGWG